MTATAATLDKVNGLIDGMVQAILDAPQDVLLADAAEDIVDELRRTDPEALIDWFLDHAVALIRERLQTRLAVQRRQDRVGVFDTHESRPHLEQRYAVEGNVWRRVGDMRRPDWQYLVEQRSIQIRGNLFDLLLAKLIIKRLPDDVTPTSAVVSEDELHKLEQQAERRAEQAVSKLSA